jgi:hypothetical protein
MGGNMIRTLILTLGLLGFALAQDRGDFIVAYEDAASQTQLEFARFLQQQGFLEGLVDNLNKNIALPNDIGVVAAPCGQPNAYWAPDQETLVICYDLFDYMSQVFRGQGGSNQELIEKILGAVEFIFYHELGHALIDTFEIPYTGRQEDAVDQFSSILLLNQGKAESALSGATFFVSGSSSGNTPYWDEHSLDEQRFYDIVCLVFGSNPEAYDHLIKRESVFGLGGGDGILPKQRAARCPTNFKEINSSWNRLIEAYIPSVNAQPAVTANSTPGVSIAQATNKDSYSEQFSGQLRQGDQQLEAGQYFDVYEVTLIKGQEVTFELSSTEFDTYLVVTGPNQETYFNDDVAENVNGFVSKLTLPVTQSGTYSIGVSSYEAAEVGNYTVGMVQENGVYDESVAGTLNQGDQKYQSGQFYDAYQQNFEMGQEATVVLSSIEFDPYLIVTSPSGEEFVNDDFENQMGLARVDFVAKESGVYTIYATSYDQNERGNYQLSVSDGVKAIAVGQGDVRTNIDENSTMGELTRSDNQLKDGSYVDYYTLNVTEGQRLMASIMSADFDAYLGLLKPNGEVIEANRSSDGRTASLDIKADQSGVWYVVVTSAQPGQTGNYLVSIR